MTAENEFKEKCRKLLFNSGLKQFPTLFEMYLRTFGLNVDLEQSMADIVAIIRSSIDADTAYTLVCHYLDELEEA